MRTLLFLLLLTLPFAPGCGLLIGNVKPVSEKAEDYRILNLANQSADWELMQGFGEPNTAESKEQAGAIPDVAYQSRRTAAIISLNSGCRPSHQSAEHSLKAFTDQLLLGVARITSKEEKEITVAGLPALETTAQGKINDESVKLRTVVLQQERCVYDLTYITRPEHFAKEEAAFSQFVASFRVR